MKSTIFISLILYTIILVGCNGELICDTSSGTYHLIADTHAVQLAFETATLPSFSIRYWNISNSKDAETFKIDLNFNKIGEFYSNEDETFWSFSDFKWTVNCSNTTDPENSTTILTEKIEFSSIVPNNASITFTYTWNSLPTVVPHFFPNGDLSLKEESFETSMIISNWKNSKPDGQIKIEAGVFAEISIFNLYPSFYDDHQGNLKVLEAQAVYSNIILYVAEIAKKFPLLNDSVVTYVDTQAHTHVDSYAPPKASILLFYPDPGNDTLEYKTAVTFSPIDLGKKNWIMICIGIGVGVVAIGTLAIVVFIIYKKNPGLRWNGDINTTTDTTMLENGEKEETRENGEKMSAEPISLNVEENEKKGLLQDHE